MPLTFSPDANGRAHIAVTADDGSSVTVYEQGAHLVSWKNKDGEEMLYTSPNAIYANRVPIRGGVPLIFPQFGNRGNLTPPHGFARLRPWVLESVDTAAGTVTLSLQVPIDNLSLEGSALAEVSPSSKNILVLFYTAAFSNTTLSLRVVAENQSEETPASFHFAFHTYFHVSNVEAIVLNGVNRTPFFNQAKSEKGASRQLRQPEVTWRVKGEMERVYPKQNCAIMLQDPAKTHILHVSSQTLPDVVVWNPGQELTEGMKDLPSDGYMHFLCVEHGAIMNRVKVPPQGKWSASQEIHLLSQRLPASKL